MLLKNLTLALGLMTTSAIGGTVGTIQAHRNTIYEIEPQTSDLSPEQIEKIENKFF